MSILNCQHARQYCNNCYDCYRAKQENVPPEDIELIKKYKKRAAKKATKAKNTNIVYRNNKVNARGGIA